MRVRANLNGGTSSASNNRPSGNIQRPKMGRKLSNPPQIRRIAAARRIQADDDCLSHRTAALNRGGSRAISRSTRGSCCCPAKCFSMPSKLQRHWPHTSGEFGNSRQRFYGPCVRTAGSAQAHHGRARGAEHIAPSLSLLIKSWCAQTVPKFLPTAGTFGCKTHLGSSQPLFAPWARIAVCDVPSWPRRGARASD